MSKIEKKCYIAEYFEIDGDFDYIISELNRLKEKYSNYIRLSFERTWDELEIYGYRLETNEEEVERLEKDRSKLVKARERKLKQLEKLKEDLGID